MTNKQTNQVLAVVCSFVFILGMLTVVLIMKAKGDIHASQPAITYAVDAYEDGSGVVYMNRKGETPLEVATLPENILPWDCNTNGNMYCGENVTSDGGCTQFVIAADNRPALVRDLTIAYCTDGMVNWWDATDVDVEGEVI